MVKWKELFDLPFWDFNKSESYPSNFVCMLPLKMAKGKVTNVFMDYFGDQSLEVAMGLLKEALKRETDFQVKSEIERRLKTYRSQTS